LYQVTDVKGDSIRISRLDSTIFFGYNGAEYVFTHNDTIMSFGGSGYWRINGQLRYYSENDHEWDLLPLNEEIPSHYVCAYHDTLSDKFYYLQIPYVDPVVNKEQKDYTIFVLDLQKRENALLGKFNPHFANERIYPTINSLQLPSLNGVMMLYGGDMVYLLDFVNNASYKLKNTSIEKIFFGNSKGVFVNLAFERNGWLYFTKSNDPQHRLDSVAIKESDFIKLNEPVYFPSTNASNIYAIGVGILAMFFAIGWWLYSKKKKIPVAHKDVMLFSTSDNSFKPIELELVQKIYAVSQMGKSYSVEDVNTALGLGRKSLEIQKKVRTDTLNRINHRFKMQFETQDDLIERVRSEDDRRYYRYFIREENMKKFTE
jgi:hypothetical protein